MKKALEEMNRKEEEAALVIQKNFKKYVALKEFKIMQ
jgi:hypothetical protein